MATLDNMIYAYACQLLALDDRNSSGGPREHA